MSKWIDIYSIPSGIDADVCHVIRKQMDKVVVRKGTTGDETDERSDSLKSGYPEVRSSKVSWLHTDNWISGMMAHFINCANLESFEFDLVNWGSDIQYTIYDEEGDCYDWHIDGPLQSAFNPNHYRKLSISLCLSSKDEYDGGELDVRVGTLERNYKIDMGDVIIFPSDTLHRVRPIKSGKRISLVGWYAGPKFK